jgi:hypothetical protein
MDGNDKATRGITGGVDTHKDLHVAAVVDDCDRVLDTRSFATTRQGYRQMLAKAYVARRVAEGHSKLEAIRVLKRTLRARYSASSCGARKTSTQRGSLLDKQKGVQG